MTPSVIGLDLSSTRTGICLPDGTTEHVAVKGELLDRAMETADALYCWLLPQVDLVVIEAIGTRHVQTAISLAYVHCLVDRMLREVNVIKVSPAALKKFATNNGNAAKHEMTVAAMRNGWESGDDSTDDESDSWWLWALGMHLMGAPVVPETDYRAGVINKLEAA